MEPYILAALLAMVAAIFNAVSAFIMMWCIVHMSASARDTAAALRQSVTDAQVEKEMGALPQVGADRPSYRQDQYGSPI